MEKLTSCILKQANQNKILLLMTSTKLGRIHALKFQKWANFKKIAKIGKNSNEICLLGPNSALKVKDYLRVS